MLASALLLIGLMVTQDGSKDKNEELQRFQGDWELVAISFLGQPRPLSFAMTYTFKDNQYAAVALGRKTPIKVTFVLDPAKEPKQIDVTSSNASKRAGIYKIEGDTLTICTAMTGERPTVFMTKERQWDLLVLKRADKGAPASQYVAGALVQVTEDAKTGRNNVHFGQRFFRKRAHRVPEESAEPGKGLDLYARHARHR